VNLIESLAWAVVELQSPKPDMGRVREVLEKSLQAAATLDLKHQMTTANVVRMALVAGLDDDLRGGTPWK
jgi:hypothetical protein